MRLLRLIVVGAAAGVLVMFACIPLDSGVRYVNGGLSAVALVAYISQARADWDHLDTHQRHGGLWLGALVGWLAIASLNAAQTDTPVTPRTFGTTFFLTGLCVALIVAAYEDHKS